MSTGTFFWGAFFENPCGGVNPCIEWFSSPEPEEASQHFAQLALKVDVKTLQAEAATDAKRRSWVPVVDMRVVRLWGPF